ncbi:hypothetical protein FO516_16615, partial [Priestia megaterium]
GMNMDEHASHDMEGMNMDEHTSHDMEGMKDMNAQDNDNNEENTETHTLLIISDIKDNYKLNLKENKQEITNNYIANNYYKEQIDLNNYLRAKYEIRKD